MLEIWCHNTMPFGLDFFVASFCPRLALPFVLTYYSNREHVFYFVLRRQKKRLSLTMFQFISHQPEHKLNRTHVYMKIYLKFYAIKVVRAFHLFLGM